MSQTPENQRERPNAQVINDEYRLEANTEFDRAGTAAERARLSTDLQNALRDLTKPENIDIVNSLKNAKNEVTRNAVRKLLVRFLRGVARKIIEYNDPVKQAFFAELEKYNLTDDKIAHLYELITKYSDNTNTVVIAPPGQPPSPFENDLFSLQTTSPETFNILIEVLKTSEVLSKFLGDKDALKAKLDTYLLKVIEPESAPKNQEEAERLASGIKDKYDQYLKKIDDTFKGASATDLNDREEILDFLWNSDYETLAVAHGDADASAYESRLKELLINKYHIVANENELTELVSLSKLYRRSGESNRYIEQNAPEEIREYMKKFDDREVFGRIVIPQADGSFKWNDKEIESVKKQVRQMVNALFRKVDENPNIEFREIYNDLIEGQILRAIADRFYQMSESKYVQSRLKGTAGEVTTKKFYDFVRKGIVQQIYFERNHRELYHNVVTVFNLATPDKWPGFFSRMNISEFSTLTEDPLINSALEVWKNYLQEVVIRNGNKIPPNLLGGKIKRENEQQEALPVAEQLYEFKEREEFIKAIKEHMRLVTGKTPDDWEVERAFSIARGITAMTMEMSAVLSNTTVTNSYESVPLANILSIHNPRFLWGWGRGGRDELMKTAAIYMMKVKQSELKGEFWQRWDQVIKERWIPTEANKLGKRWEDEIEGVNTPEEFDETVDRFMEQIFNDNTTWYNLIQKVSMGDWISQGNWRIAGVRKTYEDEFRRKGENGQDIKWGDDWNHIYTWFNEKMGVTMGFTTFSGDRAQHDAYSYLKKQPNIVRDIMSKRLKRPPTDSELKAALADGSGWGEEDEANLRSAYHFIRGSKRDDRILKVTRNGETVQLSSREYYNHRLDGIRGESFYNLLQKDPIAFLNNVAQLMPVLQDGRVKLEEGKEWKTAEEFYFGPETGLSRKDLDKRNKFLNYIKERFENRTSTVENYNQLKTIMGFYTKLYDEYKVFEENISESDRDLRRAKARQVLFTYLTAAHGKVASRHEAKIIPTDICSDADFANPTTDNARDAARIRRLMFEGNDSFINHFDSYVQTIGGWGDGKENLGRTDAFFQRLAHTWFVRNNISVIPQGDLNHQLLFRDIDASGEDHLLRTFGAFDTVSKVQEQLMKLYSKLKKVARTETNNMYEALGTKSGIFELHSQIKDLEPFIGQQDMREIQYYVATITTRFFQQHYGKRLPPGLSNLASLQLGVENTGPGSSLSSLTSLSKLYYGKPAFEMNTDQIREYARWLKAEGCINSGGQWSYDQFLKEVGAESTKFWLAEFAPNVSIYFILFILYEYIKDAFAEESGEGEKKQ